MGEECEWNGKKEKPPSYPRPRIGLKEADYNTHDFIEGGTTMRGRTF